MPLVPYEVCFVTMGGARHQANAAMRQLSKRNVREKENEGGECGKIPLLSSTRLRGRKAAGTTRGNSAAIVPLGGSAEDLHHKKITHFQTPHPMVGTKPINRESSY